MFRLPKSVGLLYALLIPLWMATVADMLWWRFGEFYLYSWMLTSIQVLVFSATAAAGLVYCLVSWNKSVLSRSAALTWAYIPVWQWLVYVADKLNLDLIRVFLAQAGLALLFMIGLVWLIWYLERCAELYRQRELALGLVPSRREPRIWNPLNPKAWYFFRSRKLNQSAAAFSSYSLAFALAIFLFSRIQGCQELYEMPAGGGKAQTQTVQKVQIQKVIRKKFVINPFSLIKFNPPPIDEIKLNLAQATEHLYKVGYGDGEGAGFGAGTSRGKVRFIRLEYQGGDWDQDFGVGADLNMLIQYNVLTSQKVADQTESRPIAALRNFPLGKSPPMMYLTGQRSISLSDSEIKILREYLVDKHGMIFGDNGGSNHFHNQFFSAMRQVLPELEPVRIPLDDVIHRVPFALPFLPYVAPHGGRDAWGWKLDGRWVVYYHPGDIGDAWADGHSNVPREVYESCYQLGTNVIFYAHAEYNKWLDAQKKK